MMHVAVMHRVVMVPVMGAGIGGRDGNGGGREHADRHDHGTQFHKDLLGAALCAGNQTFDRRASFLGGVGHLRDRDRAGSRRVAPTTPRP